MKQTAFALLLLCLSPLFAFSQTNISVGAPYRVIDAASKYYFSQNGEILTVKVDGERILIQKFSADNLSFKQIKEYEDFGNGFTLEDVKEFAGKHYLFYSIWDKPNKTEQLFAREIDFAAGSFKGAGVNLLKVEGKISGDFSSGFTGWGFSFGGGYNVTGKFAFHYSDDNSKLMVQYRRKPETKKDENSYDIIGFNVYEKDLKTFWKKEITMPYTEKKMNNIDYTVDSEGNAYTLAQVYNDNTTDTKKGKKATVANYHIELLKFASKSGQLTKTTVEVANKFINKVWLYESPNPNEMICAGFYNNGTDPDAANGVIVFKMAKDGKVLSSNTYEIPLEILNQNISARAAKKNTKKDEDGKAEFSELELRKLIVEEDGSLLLIGEQYYIVQHTSTSSNGRTTTYYTYHYNDMLVTKIDANQKLAWMRKLPKKQTGRAGRGGMSFKYIGDGTNHYLLFLDHEKNKDLQSDQVPTNHSDGQGGFLTAYKLSDSKGTVSKFSIFDTRDVKGTEIYQFNTGRIFAIAKDQFVVEAYKKKKEDILIKISFEK